MSWSAFFQTAGKLFQWWITVAPWEQGVRVRLGKTTKCLMPGVHFRIPFLDRIVRTCIRDRIITTKSQTVSTLDGKVLTMALSLNYSIKDATKMLNTIARPEETLRAMALGEAARLVANTSSRSLTPQLIESGIYDKLDASRWGLKFAAVYVTTFVYARTFRLLQSGDDTSYSSIDNGLDTYPATIS